MADGPDPRAAVLRERMVDEQIAARGVTDERVLAAMRAVPRHEFVSSAQAADAYTDRPLPIGHDATISQPYIVAAMAEALELTGLERVLEIGTGSGYAAAILGELAAEVVTIELVPELAEAAVQRLADRENVTVVCGDGSLGWPDRAPYDAIVATAAASEVPTPLLDQLAIGGRLVAPVGDRVEHLVRLRRTPDGITTDTLMAVRFVPLRGEHGRTR
jgi:protein-L-isoaspartate(D-aspartate) O-methyltransferase